MGVVNGRDWSSGLFESLTKGSCCTACCCPCLMFGKIRSNLDKITRPQKSTSMTTQAAGYYLGKQIAGDSFGTFLEFALRSEVRDRLGIEGSLVNDCLVAGFCSPCGLTQMEVETDPTSYGLVQSTPTPTRLPKDTVFTIDGFWENTMDN